MLPPELIYLTCSYLSVQDVVSLYRALPHYRWTVQAYLSAHHTSMEIIDACLDRPSEVGALIRFQDIKVSSSQFTPYLVEKYQKHLNWLVLSRNSALSLETIISHQEKLDWSTLCINPTIFRLADPVAFIKRFSTMKGWDWDQLSCNQGLFERADCLAIIDTFLENWNWPCIEENLPLTIELIKRYWDRWDWNHLSSEGKVTVEVIDHFDRWSWLSLGGNQNLSQQEKRKYRHRWLVLLEQYRDDPDGIIFCSHHYMNIDEWSLQWWRFAEYVPLSVELLEQSLGHPCWCWSSASTNLTLTSELLQRYWDRWDMYHICRNRALGSILSDDLFVRLIDRQVDWRALSANDSLCSFLTDQLLEQYQDCWDWRALLRRNPKLAIRFHCHISLEEVIRTGIISIDFIMENYANSLGRKTMSRCLSARRDLTVSFILAHPEFDWDWMAIIQCGAWTWSDVLNHPELPWTEHLLCRYG